MKLTPEKRQAIASAQKVVEAIGRGKKLKKDDSLKIDKESQRSNIEAIVKELSSRRDEVLSTKSK